jgi:hypothetical protein
MNKKSLALPLLSYLALGFSNSATADYTSTFTFSAARASIDSDQSHKDVDVNQFGVYGKYFLESVSPYEKALGASEFVSRNAYVFGELESIDQTPKDDFKLFRAGFDGRVMSSDWRIKLGVVRSGHETELRDDDFDGGLIGLGYHASEYGLLMLNYERMTGDGYEFEDLMLDYQLLVDAPNLTYRVSLYYEHEKRKTPFESFRIGKGFKDSAWGGSVGLFVTPQLELGVELRSMSINYLSKDDGAFNALTGYMEYYYSESVSFGLKGTVSKEIIERDQLLDEVAEIGLGLNLYVSSRF